MEPEAQPGCDGEEVNNAQGGGEEHVYQGLALKTWFCTLNQKSNLIFDAMSCC